MDKRDRPYKNHEKIPKPKPLPPPPDHASRHNPPTTPKTPRKRLALEAKIKREENSPVLSSPRESRGPRFPGKTNPKSLGTSPTVVPGRHEWGLEGWWETTTLRAASPEHPRALSVIVRQRRTEERRFVEASSWSSLAIYNLPLSSPLGTAPLPRSALARSSCTPRVSRSQERERGILLGSKRPCSREKRSQPWRW
ncbi:hypothetical protein KM043_004383 [Ampulex compressa]|nr:hypothetical protein KM043_004383 [Ampulex compressa]